MEVPNPHSGGLPSASRWAPLNGVPPPPSPPSPTPIYRGGPRVLDMPINLEQISSSESSRAPSRASSKSSRTTQSAQNSRKRGERDQILGRSLNPGRSLRKHYQALAESLESQKLERQAELETIQAYINQIIETQTVQQQIREQQYKARIKALEEKVQELQQAKFFSTKPGPKTAQNKLLQAPQAPQAAQNRKAEFSTHRPQNRAASNNKSNRPETTYADIAALLKTNPGGQEWQTVTKKRYQKHSRI
ncbi:hypothetical protein BDV36DRAFT_297103 [Aspergillus pseudocaelatus]|uniref:Uncharacterized protein n=1 Tax=Aspergillus pseudocaelatus TaxID=1825620 RepID=A0ABQ6WH43_9EURO|nr:hypothetical protein BDV36DRAFT_297103 [Aspergillus pseudocaelatus]